jgi:hypothetical protein
MKNKRMTAQTSDIDNLKAEAQAILKLAAEAGADNKAIEKSFNTALNSPKEFLVKYF